MANKQECDFYDHMATFQCCGPRTWKVEETVSSGNLGRILVVCGTHIEWAVRCLRPCTVDIMVATSQPPTLTDHDLLVEKRVMTRMDNFEKRAESKTELLNRRLRTLERLHHMLHDDPDADLDD